MTDIKRNLQIKFDQESFEMLEKLAKEKGLPWASCLRVMVREAYRKWEGEKKYKE